MSTSTCKCVKSKCLQLYCECFAKGTICTDSCVCIDCKNTKADASSSNSPTKTDSKMKVSGLDDQQATKKKKPTLPLATSSGKKSTQAVGKYKRGDGCSCKNSK